MLRLLHEARRKRRGQRLENECPICGRACADVTELRDDHRQWLCVTCGWQGSGAPVATPAGVTYAYDETADPARSEPAT